MNPQDFADKWRALAPNTSERAAYQEHFRDLCALLGQPTPSSDLSGQDYAFEKAVKVVGTGEQGFADVFKRDFFIFEYKGKSNEKSKDKTLGKALAQAYRYAPELGSPPLLVVSDLVRIEVHTNFTGTSPRRFVIDLEDLAEDRVVGGNLTALQVLRAVFTDPSLLDPRQLRERITEEATAQIGAVAASLRGSGAGTQSEIAHFLMRVVFAMFSEDVGLLESQLLTRLLESARRNPPHSQKLFSDLFAAMRGGGYFGPTEIRHFNGGLFDDDSALSLTAEQLDQLLAAAKLDWSEVEPAIFGTLFESSLDPAVRAERGAHFTRVKDILRIVEPVIMQPLQREWVAVKTKAEALAQKGTKGKRQALELVQQYRVRLQGHRVLDPACGSGNFLVVAMILMLNHDRETIKLAESLGAGSFDVPPVVHPRQFHGIEIEPFAHELASVSIWIAFFQWQRTHGGQWPTPVLQRLLTIENRDAVLNEDGTEAEWPQADFIVGNPPFIGNTRMRRRLGDAYVEQLWITYAERVSNKADFVTYWLEKARAEIAADRTWRAGLIMTNSVRGGASRKVLERVKESGDIFAAWPDMPWMQDGAAVRVSEVAFDDGSEKERYLGWLTGPDETEEVVQTVGEIHADLTGGLDLTGAQRLKENAGRSFEGVKPAGKFDLTEQEALSWLDLPNPSGVSNRDVLKPYISGKDLTEGEERRPGRWLIDFNQMPLEEAQQYRRPMQQVRELVWESRRENRDTFSREHWWLHQRLRPEMRRAVAPLSRFLATTIHAKHRFFVWLTPDVIPNNSLAVIAAEDDFTYGVLHSAPHLWWAARLGTSLGVGNDSRYTASTTFETYPFPQPTADVQREQVAQAARYLEQVRQHLLKQADPSSKSGQTLGLTSIYNLLEEYRQTRAETVAGIASLADAHDLLDTAVAAAYGWEWPLTEEEVLARLLELNRERT